MKRYTNRRFTLSYHEIHRGQHWASYAPTFSTSIEAWDTHTMDLWTDNGHQHLMPTPYVRGGIKSHISIIHTLAFQ